MARPRSHKRLGQLEASTRQVYEAVRRLTRVTPDLMEPDGRLRPWDQLDPWRRRLLTAGYADLAATTAAGDRVRRQQRALEEALAMVDEWLAEPLGDAAQSRDALAHRIAARLLERDETIVELVRVGMAVEG